MTISIYLTASKSTATQTHGTKMDLWILSACILLIPSIYFYLRLSRSETPQLPPGPRGLPIVGYLPFLEVNLHHQLTTLGHKHGPIYKLKLGSKLCVVISSPELVRAVVRDHDSVFANRSPTAAAMAAHGCMDIFWSSNGPYWRDMRKLFVREMLSHRNLEDTYELRVGEVNKLVGDLHGRIGEAVGIGELVFAVELRVLMKLLWGGTTRGRQESNAQFRVMVSEFVDLLGKPNVSDFFPFLASFDLQGIVKKMRAVAPKIEEFIDLIIDEKMKMMRSGEGDKRKNDLLEILLDLKDQKVGDDSSLSFGLFQMKAVLMDIIVSGTDTTATTVEWMMSELLGNPNVMEKVQHELEHVVGSNNSVEESHLPKLRYLDAVVKETMRLHPPLPLIPRLPTKATTIGGYTIPKGTPVLLNIWSIHMDPQFWENPTEFKLERFLHENGDCNYRGNNFKYFPFGSGRRICPGLTLGERMVMYLLATLLHSFEWRLPEGDKFDLSGTFIMVMRKTKPLLAIPYQPSHCSTI